MTVISAAEVGVVVADNPLGTIADNPSRLLVFVLTHPPDELMQKSLASARYIWIITGDGRDPRPYLPEARLVLAREFPHVAIVYKIRLPTGP